MRRRVFEYRLYCQAHQQWFAVPEARLQGSSYSRIGRKFYELEPTDVNDVFAICSANGVTDRKHR